jgi:CheY-like chemotaxis protein
LVLSNFRPGLYDLVLVDVMMPKVDSFELYERIKKVNPDVKVCFLTASEMYYEKIGGAKYYTLNKEMFLLKPISTRSKKENKQQDKLHLIGNRGIK